MLKPKPAWLEPLFPYEQKALQVNGRVMAYVDEGDPAAIPVLLFPGHPTRGLLYRDFIPVLTEADFRAIAPDWVGYGHTDHPRYDAALTFAHHIADPVTWDSMRLISGMFKNAYPLITVPKARHYIQEDAGEATAAHIVQWLAENGLDKDSLPRLRP